MENEMSFPLTLVVVQCEVCGGSGRTLCHVCNGTGNSNYYRPDSKPSKCFTCKGPGRLPCSGCEGTGQVEVEPLTDDEAEDPAAVAALMSTTFPKSY